ncbi:ATP-binding protein [Candidatus Daviesbacteria bacterium]|nr:ATP-binding protein [Candidatus Daviesbacteria bacterium]
MIKRFYNDLSKYLFPNKVLIIYGPRRVGKTVLLNNFLSSSKLKYKFVSGDDLDVQTVLSSQRIELIKEYTRGYELFVIDEAQKIPNIGMGLKILVDNIEGIKVIATGSASFDLSNKIGEPLVGRSVTLKLYPLAQLELAEDFNRYELKEKNWQYLIYGSYPEALTAQSLDEKRDYLTGVVNSYLLKDILELEQVKGSKILLDLLRLVAFQVGSEVSLSELALNLNIDIKTVARYLDLLEKAFILINIRGLSRNLRKEIKKYSKYYFYDNGIRNAVISNFNPLDLRDDIGRIWENFLVTERIKKQAYKKIYSNNYFWRTWDQKEIDFVEEREGKLFGFEFKYSSKKVKLPQEFLDTYPNASIDVITRDNYLDFVI